MRCYQTECNPLIILLCRQECIDLKKMNQESQDVIAGLRKDLAGAQARLSVSECSRDSL